MKRVPKAVQRLSKPVDRSLRSTRVVLWTAALLLGGFNVKNYAHGVAERVHATTRRLIGSIADKEEGQEVEESPRISSTE